MKGMVFTEFIEMVEDNFSFDVADEILDNADLESDGVYTAVGNYDHNELIQLVGHLSEATDIEPSVLVNTYGKHLFSRLGSMYPNFFEEARSAFDLLLSVEDHIHVEVRKLYPRAELPTFEYQDVSDDKMVMIYQSARPFADLAEGMISGCIDHFQETIEIQREDLDGEPGTHARFTLIRQAK